MNGATKACRWRAIGVNLDDGVPDSDTGQIAPGDANGLIQQRA